MTASNIVSTVDQARQEFQFSSSVAGLLKDVYIPELNNTTFYATPLMAMFNQFGGSFKFEGNKVIKAFKHQGAGGFGAISEGGDFVKGRQQKGFQGYERLKYLNAYFSLTGPAIETVMQGQGSYVDAVASSMEDTLLLAKMHMERMCAGSGDGEIARFANKENGDVLTLEYIGTADTQSSTTFSATTTLTASGGGAYTKVQWMQPGIRVNLVAVGDFDGTIPTTDWVEAVDTTRAVFEVGHVDYAAGTFSLKNVSGQSVEADEMDVETLVIVLENAYGAIEDPEGSLIDQSLELNGLYNLVDDGATYSKIWNLTRATYPHALKSTVVDAGGQELDEDLLIEWILDLVNIKQSVPDVLVTDPKSRLKYFGNRKEDRRFDTTVVKDYFGLESIGVQIDNYTLLIQSLSSLVPGTLFMLKTNDFMYTKATEGFKWLEGGTGVLRPFEEKDGRFATAVNYCNFVCANPNGQLKVTDLAF